MKGMVTKKKTELRAGSGYRAFFSRLKVFPPSALASTAGSVDDLAQLRKNG